MVDRRLPIGVMDSGIGGISVLKEAIRILPGEDFIYYGDSAHAPYGTKSREEIRKLTLSACEELVERGIKALVIACNTATSAAVTELRERYAEFPVIGIEPAVKPAVVCNQGGRIIVMATPMTIRQQKFRDLLEMYRDEADIVPLACEGLMEFVEKGDMNGKEVREYLQEILSPVLTEKTESIVLGCTHYPFLKPVLRDLLGERRIALIDGSKGTSSQLKRRLQEEGLLREGEHPAKITVLNSMGDTEIIARCYRLLTMNLD